MEDRQRKRDAAKKSSDRHIYTTKSVRIKEAQKNTSCPPQKTPFPGPVKNKK